MPSIRPSTIHPAVNPKSVVRSKQARFSVITPSIIRMEWSADSKFEDRPSLVFIHRYQPAPKFDVHRRNGRLKIKTSKLTLRYRENSERFSRDNLSIEFTLNGKSEIWSPGMEDKGNLGGTVRTLDRVMGSCPLDTGILSRDGWVVVDDSERPILDRRNWPRARESSFYLDWYFFGYGHDYPCALRDFVKISGSIPLPPKFSFGSWWSRYWAYTDHDLMDLVRQFREYDVPLDVLVIDMDWHLDGWTGYTWDPKYFPEPKRFLKWVRGRGLKVTLNLHPAKGVRNHEKRFAQMCRAMGLNPKTTDQIPFDCADPRYMKSYFKILHHPIERQGVDFWWMDWQQGTTTKIKGLDPLWWLNHLHWLDMEQNRDRKNRRPLVFSRWGGLGNHRYPVGFSGDTYSAWSSLAFQPYFTATAGNVGYAYWSHDIGGHLPGAVDPEMYARWIQWGAFSPILRTHTTKNTNAERRIWEFPKNIFDSARKFFHLRYELIPYIYTQARRCFDTGMPICRPLYYEWPELEKSYSRKDEYLFGDQFLAAPVAVPMNSVSQCSEISVWLPPGEWIHWFTGRAYRGPKDIQLLVPIDEIPLFVRSGAVIPTMPKTRSTAEETSSSAEPLILHIFPGQSGSTRVYEDDGESSGYQNGEFAWTFVYHRRTARTWHITVGPTGGKYKGMPVSRGYEIRLRDVWPAMSVYVNGKQIGKNNGETGWEYDPATLSVVVRVFGHLLRDKIEIKVFSHPGSTNESMLRRGLRGQLALIDHVAQLSRGRIPAQVEKAGSIRRQLGFSPEKSPILARPIGKNWDEYVSEVSESGMDAPAKNEALMRLLGLSCRIRANGMEKNTGRILVSADVTISSPCAGRQDISGAVELLPPPHWRIGGKTRVKFKNLNEDNPVKLSAVIMPRDTVNMISVRAKTSVNLSHGRRIDLTSETALLPSINSWWIAGPFDDPAAVKMKKIFPPEKLKWPIHFKTFKETYSGKRGEVIRWRPVERAILPESELIEEFYVDFHKVFGYQHNNAIAYAVTFLHAPRPVQAAVAIGSDDGVAVWINGAEVFRNPAGRPYVSKQDRVPVRLKKGCNALLLKISQAEGEWGFCAHLETGEGTPLPEVAVRLTP